MIESSMAMPLPSRLARRASRRQRGVTLIEALVALLVMSFGMLALVGLMSNLRRGADLAKQRSEAMRIARAEMAKLKDFSVLDSAGAPAGSKAYSDITNQAAATSVTPVDSNTTYGVQRFVTPVPGAQAVRVRMGVTWTDRAGDAQFINLDTVIASVDPLFSAALGFAPPAGPVTQPSARSPLIPPGAKQLDGKISAFSPNNTPTNIWIFNNVTGVITGTCNLPINTVLSALTAADVEGCKNGTVGYLLSGVIRFSNSSPPNPSAPGGTAIPLGLSIVDGNYSLPRLVNGIPVMSGGNMVLDTLTARAPVATVTLPAPACFPDSPSSSPSTQPFVTYNCIVYPPDAGAVGASPTWSGKLVLTGFATGTTAAEYRVCRYSADYNGNGSRFTTDLKALENEEHPEVYGKVTGSLARQNFLVIRGDLDCPTAPAVNPSAFVFADYSTVQLQPTPGP